MAGARSRRPMRLEEINELKSLDYNELARRAVRLGIEVVEERPDFDPPKPVLRYPTRDSLRLAIIDQIAASSLTEQTREMPTQEEQEGEGDEPFRSHRARRR